jgi:hypothetical protein
VNRAAAASVLSRATALDRLTAAASGRQSQTPDRGRELLVRAPRRSQGFPDRSDSRLKGLD